MPTKRQRTASRKPAKKRKYTKKEREAAQHVIDATEAVREIHRPPRYGRIFMKNAKCGETGDWES